MQTQSTSFILRYRDLVTAKNGTIERHKEIAEKHGDVWWGWWNKSGEQPAAHAFAALTKTPPLPILLFDSGQSLLCRANCLEVKYELGKRVGSPDKNKTPDYYRDQQYRAWFRLSKFEQIGSNEIVSVLRGLAYERVDEFFETTSSPFSAFYGKRLHDAEELVQQNRTIWFTRPFREGDLVHKVHLLNAEHSKPQHFSSVHFPTRSSHFLWVSDLHFSDDRDHHGFPLVAATQEHTLGVAVERALESLGIDALSGVIVSGDITWAAKSREFELAREQFFQRVMSTFSLDPRQIVVCPGNHDLAFSSSPASKHQVVDQATDCATAEYGSFFENLFHIRPNEFMSTGRRLLVGGALPVDIVALNSSLLQQYPRPESATTDAPAAQVFQGQGFIGRRQLDDASSALGWDSQGFSPVRPYRVVVLHHHVVPVTEADLGIAGENYSVVLDAERLVRWLIRHRVDIVLHGHQHQPFSVSITRQETVSGSAPEHSFRILGMGSTGVAQKHQGALGKNTFGLLGFGADGLRLEIHSIHRRDNSEKLFEMGIPYTPLGTRR